MQLRRAAPRIFVIFYSSFITPITAVSAEYKSTIINTLEKEEKKILRIRKCTSDSKAEKNGTQTCYDNTYTV